jgi:hypothetical protein
VHYSGERDAKGFGIEFPIVLIAVAVAAMKVAWRQSPWHADRTADPNQRTKERLPKGAGGWDLRV